MADGDSLSTELFPIWEQQEPMCAWPDEKLVEACLSGEQKAWHALIDKYKKLIYSIPVKNGFSQEDASEIFQSVCVDLFSELQKLRQPKALAGWLIQVTSHKCFHLRKQQKRLQQTDPESPEPSGNPDSHADNLICQLEREQALREAFVLLPDRCKELIHALFFSDPPLPYDQVAKSLGVAVGSIGFIRGRCLTKLRKSLETVGFN